MADQKISELTALTGANVADDDAIAIVDTSATETKKIVFSELKNALDTATGFVRITGDTMTGDLSMGDNVKAIFGAGSDLQIYHDGSHSYIHDAGTGDLYVRADDDLRLQVRNSADDDWVNALHLNSGGETAIHYNGNKKLATTATGIDVTGTVTATGNTNTEADSIVKAISNNGTVDTSLTFGGLAGSANLKFYTNGTTERLKITSGGDISFYEDTGTTPKFFWDASAESLGIGTSSPSETLDVSGNIRALGANSRVMFGPDGFEAGIKYATDASLQIASRTGENITFTNGNDGTERMRIDSSGNVGIGLSSSLSGLNINGAVRSQNSASNISYMGFTSYTGTTAAGAMYSYVGGDGRATGYLNFSTNDTEAMRIDSSGNVGIATTANVSLTSSEQGFWYQANDWLAVSRSAGTVAYLNRLTSDGNILELRKDGTTVGSIGVNSGDLMIGTGDTGMRFSDGEDSFVPSTITGNANRDNAIDLGKTSSRFKDLYLSGSAQLANITNGAGEKIILNSDNMVFQVQASEAMRLDSSGNLLVGTTTVALSDATSGSGIALQADGQLEIARAGTGASDVCARFNRSTGDGPIVEFRKSGSTVGSIGTKARTSAGRIFVGNSNTRLLFDNGVDAIIPANNDGNDRDNAIDLGASGARFDDIYATNGTIQTSDRNEKQDIAELSDAEQRVAVAAKGLLRKFRWKDAVAEKGDEARTHFGIIAQDLQAAFAAEGLDAGDYAMFISSTWTDEETGEERTRMGVRYSELLAFIIAAI